jgi:hypothetical protein
MRRASSSIVSPFGSLARVLTSNPPPDFLKKN